jgi:hypothetical protein
MKRWELSHHPLKAKMATDKQQSIPDACEEMIPIKMFMLEASIWMAGAR